MDWLQQHSATLTIFAILLILFFVGKAEVRKMKP